MPLSKVSNPVQAGRRYLSGNDAAAEGAIAAGCRFYGGYPITPSSEIMEYMSRELEERGGAFLQMEDEIASISAVVGASWTGAKAMTATSGPGVSLMQECLGYAAFTETPVVVVDVQRAGPCTGQATKVGSGDIMAVKWGSHGDYQVVALSPWSVQEMFSLTIEAFNLSERLRVPAFLLAEEATGHLRERVDMPETVEIYTRDYEPGQPPFGADDPAGIPSMPSFGDGEKLLVTGSTHDQWGFRKTEGPAFHDALVRRLSQKVLSRKNEICRHDGYHLDDAELVVVAYGFTARSALSAVRAARSAGIKAGLLRLITIWPFDNELISRVAEGAKGFLVPEMNLGQVDGLVRAYAGATPVRSLTQVNGSTISPAGILAALKEMS
ncbi:MAG: 2-oxoacid:acceptor oxidoreductase subunit alpha [Desulfarculaceae bacterium]|nr:2-oxoacid:acceptor oxidoreductase subunit alpha [Desulfarculaceae bacterium]MCF8071256.1 2-oxoacid:acceptor oxidoreductase subunit alpha [Desulfarculaceae bacterium]MCF8101141.1 2-oxoacid:acceptor oxidoreductase subunit alpha [Desulfarculaceae bacterium]